MSTADTELDYLAPSFDPASLTVPKLRSILVSHDITYPSSAKKSDLIDLFNRNVVPQARKILNSRSRTKRSTRGIVDMPSSQASTADPAEDDALPERPPPVNKRSSRRTTRAATEEHDANDALHTRPPPKRASGKHARAAEAEPEERPAQRKTRKSTAPPTTRTDHPEPEAWHRPGADSPFTADNPFQSGSSPADGPAGGADRRRKTLGPIERKEKRRSEAGRRKTEQYKTEQADDGAVVPTSRTFEVPVASWRQMRPPAPDEVEPGEEFTPNEQLELENERARTGKADVLPRRRKPAASAPSVFTMAPLALTVALLGGFATVWRQEKVEVGYCGVGRASTSIGGVEIPEWAGALQPQCEPCPQHAYCYGRLETVCEPGFLLRPHPLALGGVVPLAPTCEPDGEKARKVKAVADRAVEQLRDRNARYECGELVTDQGKPARCPDIAEADLKQEMATKRRKGMTEAEFEELWSGAIGEMLGRDEVESRDDGDPRQRTLRSTSLARIPLACAVRRSLRDALARHLGTLVGLALTLALAAYARYSLTSRREMESRAKQLASFALDRLATQAARHARDPRAWPEPGLGMGHLRDDVLRDDFSAARRNALWRRVQDKVEQNSNVRPLVREGRSGDVGRVWEWVGAVAALEEGEGGDGGGHGRRDSSRYGFGPARGGSPAKREEPEMEIRSWDEGRPIY